MVDHADGTLGLAAQLDFDQGEATFPFGAHIAVVEVDRDTGPVTLLRHIAVDDCGTVLNPLLVEGQQHGGVAAGVSQALYEAVHYDDDGNPLTANFADYAIPSAAEFPMFEVPSTETPTPLNPLGAKGIGEASTIGSTPAVQNAVIDALAHLGVRHIDLPCTSEAVWRAIQRRRGGHAARPVARAAGDLRRAARPARPSTRKGSTPPKASEPNMVGPTHERGGFAMGRFDGQVVVVTGAGRWARPSARPAAGRARAPRWSSTTTAATRTVRAGTSAMADAVVAEIRRRRR